MDIEKFEKYLRRGGRSESAAARCLRYLAEFEAFLAERGKQIETAGTDDLNAYLEAVESENGKSAKTHLWALVYAFDYLGMTAMKDAARKHRQMRIGRKPFLLRDFRGVNLEAVDKLAEQGIQDVAQMLEAGQTLGQRQALVQQSGASPADILELVKLSDLARVSGLKGIRARLYYDAGIDTIEKLAACEPQGLLEMLRAFVADTGFDGIAPLPKEAQNAVRQAKSLPKIVEYGGE